MNLVYKKRALQHLISIHDHIAKNNPAAAANVVRAIAYSVERLEFFPLSGRVGSIRGTRLLAVPNLPYIVVYRIRSDIAEIIAILHTRQRRR